MAIGDLFRLLSGSELGLVLQTIVLSLQILTTVFGSLILQDTGHCGLPPAMHSGCWLIFKPGKDASAFRGLLGFALRAVLGDWSESAESAPNYLKKKLIEI